MYRITISYHDRFFLGASVASPPASVGAYESRAGSVPMIPPTLFRPYVTHLLHGWHAVATKRPQSRLCDDLRFALAFVGRDSDDALPGPFPKGARHRSMQRGKSSLPRPRHSRLRRGPCRPRRRATQDGGSARTDAVRPQRGQRRHRDRGPLGTGEKSRVDTLGARPWNSSVTA
jgi:hypothetical protein